MPHLMCIQDYYPYTLVYIILQKKSVCEGSREPEGHALFQGTGTY